MARKNNVKSTSFPYSYKYNEIPVPENLMELFMIEKKIGYESEEEKEYRERKEKYNKTILKKIKEIKENRFTALQKTIFELMFEQGLTLTEVAHKMKRGISTIQDNRDGFLKKIKKYVTYNFV